jgi:1-aminocyclopropane-1-carboxylate deaminase/D-cysteine desulfhydrase-like pyridoxal-dependent ACC family enzyme
MINNKFCTLILPLNYTDDRNKFYIKREDLLPFSSGGNAVIITEKYFMI